MKWIVNMLDATIHALRGVWHWWPWLIVAGLMAVLIKFSVFVSNQQKMVNGRGRRKRRR